jgi:hypothetical protein
MRDDGMIARRKGDLRTRTDAPEARGNGRFAARSKRHSRVLPRTRSLRMKRLIVLSGFTTALLCGPAAVAQSSPPPLPQLTPEQSQSVEKRMDLYHRETEGRVSRGEISAAEADRLLAWREWQIARQVTGVASEPVASDVPPDYYPAPSQPDYVVVAPPPYYGPYYRYPVPYYYAPRPYYWGPAVCAGGFGRHFGGRICF